MPTYVYRREDGTKFEIKQRITEDPLEKCPETGQPVERIIAGSAGLIFKGDGFYVYDYAKNNGSRKDANGTSDSAEPGESSPESSTKAEGTASEESTSTSTDTGTSSASDT